MHIFVHALLYLKDSISQIWSLAFVHSVFLTVWLWYFHYISYVGVAYNETINPPVGVGISLQQKMILVHHNKFFLSSES